MHILIMIFQQVEKGFIPPPSFLLQIMLWAEVMGGDIINLTIPFLVKSAQCNSMDNLPFRVSFYLMCPLDKTGCQQIAVDNLHIFPFSQTAAERWGGISNSAKTRERKQ